MESFFKKIIGEVSLKTLLVSLFFLLSIFGFGLIAHEIMKENEPFFDEKVFNLLRTDPTTSLFSVMKFLTFFGSVYFLLPAYLLLIAFLVIKKNKTEALNITIIAVSSTVLMFALKEIFHRKRPELPLLKTLTNFSFPSGHAVCSFIFCSVIIYLIYKSKLSTAWKWIVSILLILFSVAIGISRIVLRYHYASDVIAGFCLGFAWVIISLWVEKKLSLAKLDRELETPGPL